GFSSSVSWDWGLNLLETEATDGSGNSSWDERAVLAGDFLEYGASADAGIVAWLGEGEGGLDTLEAIGEGMVSASELDDYIPSPVYSDEEESCYDPCGGWWGGCEICVTWYALDLYVDNPSIGDVSMDLDPQSSGQLVATVTMNDPELDWEADAVVLEVDYDGDGTVSADAITVELTLEPSVDDGELVMDLTSTDVSTSGFDFDMDSWLYDAVEYFGVDVDGMVQGYMEDALQDALEDELPGMMEETLQDLEISQSMELDGDTYTVTAEPSDVDVDDHGITLTLATTFTTDTWRLDRTGSGSLFADSTAPSFSGSTGTAFDLGVDFLNQGLYAAWGGGLFRVQLTASELGVDSGSYSDMFSGLDELVLDADPLLPPVVVPDEDGLLELQMGGMYVRLYDEDAEEGEELVEAYVSAWVPLDLEASADDTLDPTIGEPTLSVFVASPQDSSMAIVETILETLLPPYIELYAAEALDGVPIPTLDGFSLTGVSVYAAGTDLDYVELYGELVEE
ncbi:MAG: hypothetical protein QGG40_02745, partial [Myxococcota bacterium]|nr:hypothetical protein [Myxococcota bacterium]